MRAWTTTTATVAALALVLASATARAQQPLETPAPPPMGAPPSPAPAATPAPPVDAAAALERARAAYEYGDMEMVIESARLVSEGRLRPTEAQRVVALRYLGIGLCVTGRPEGAETAFFELLRLRYATRLDPTTTRPDCVAFFEDVRRRHDTELRRAARDRPGKSFALAFLPPLGQFQNGHRGRGITIAALEAISLAGAIATYAQLKSWENPERTFDGHEDAAHTLKSLNAVSVAVLVITYVAGVIDGVANFGNDVDEPPSGSAARLDGVGFRF